MSRITRYFVFVLVFFSLAAPVMAQTETPEFRVHPQRDFGYGAGSNVRGSFSLTIYGSQDSIQSVTYLIDGQEMGTYNQPPFKHSFKTSQYPDGAHALTALVKTKDGREVTTPPVNLNFLSAEAESQSMTSIFIPVLGGILLLVVIGAAVQYFTLRGNPERMALGAPRQYGIKGGAICPRCGRPFAIHLWSINLIGGVLDRCDYCGRFGFVSRRSTADLAAAEQAERAAAQNGESFIPAVAENAETEEERMKKLLDESKYQE